MNSTDFLNPAGQSDFSMDMASPTIALVGAGLSLGTTIGWYIGRWFNRDGKDRLISQFYNRTILVGASQNWDEKRIKNGKLEQFKAIGAEEVKIETAKKGVVHGCYFDTRTFMDSLAKMGGQPVQLSINHNLPILQLAEPATILIDGDDYPAVRIQKKPGTEHLFQDLEALKKFCETEGLVLINEDFTPVDTPLPFSSSGSDGFIITCEYAGELARGNPKNLSIQSAKAFDANFSLFSSEIHQTPAIYFPTEKKEEAKQLFNNLKINESTWAMVENEKGLFLVPQEALPWMFKASDHKGEEIEYRTTSLPVSDKKRGVVLLSMNQSNSYFQYSHEILTLLFEGTNAFAFDNFGKGLSRGQNTKQGIVDSIDGAYQYLHFIRGFTDAQILAKGQCAGGPPTSELGRKYPNIHVWIDQAPSGYHHMVPSFINGEVERLEKGDTLLSKVLAAAGNVLNSTRVSSLISEAFPDFDVPQNLRANSGHHLFTIGAPNENGQGGDKFIPQEQQDAIFEAISDTKGKYVPMLGAEHVTDWWLVPFAKKQIRDFLSDTHISAPLFDFDGASPVIS